jgi:hypothetical protein
MSYVRREVCTRTILKRRRLVPNESTMPFVMRQEGGESVPRELVVKAKANSFPIITGFEAAAAISKS